MIIIFLKYSIENHHQVTFCWYSIAPVGFNNVIRDLKNHSFTLLKNILHKNYSSQDICLLRGRHLDTTIL